MIFSQLRAGVYDNLDDNAIPASLSLAIVSAWGLTEMELGSPGRTLVSIVLFMLVVIVLATVGYMAAGWSFSDASYMVLLTVYTVGYGEVHPIATPYLHAVTMATMIFGCTGMILLTGALVQFLTITQLQQIFGVKRMKAEVDKLEGHVIVGGFGRIGVMLAKELKAGGAKFVVLEQSEDRAREVRDLGHLCLVGDATDDSSLRDAGIARARTLASVLPNDAANVFITLSARSLNPGIEIIARGEVPSTESKLIQAGANKVVLPTHIGAERIAEMILFPETARFLRASEKMQELERTLRGLGLDMAVVVVPEKGAVTGLTIEQIERKADGQFFVVQLNRQARRRDHHAGPRTESARRRRLGHRQPQRAGRARHVRSASRKGPRRPRNLLTARCFVGPGFRARPATRHADPIQETKSTTRQGNSWPPSLPTFAIQIFWHSRAADHQRNFRPSSNAQFPRDISLHPGSFSSSSMSCLICSMALLQVSIRIARTSGVVVSE